MIPHIHHPYGIAKVIFYCFGTSRDFYKMNWQSENVFLNNLQVLQYVKPPISPACQVNPQTLQEMGHFVCLVHLQPWLKFAIGQWRMNHKGMK